MQLKLRNGWSDFIFFKNCREKNDEMDGEIDDSSLVG